MLDYRYDMDSCDVKNKGKLRRYREMRSKWLEMLRSESANAIWPQIISMNWNEAFWRTINEARRLAIEDPKADVTFNSHLCNFLDHGYVAMQALAIRRLIDPHKEVVSLSGLVKSIRRNSHLITREIYVGYDGLPYDPRPANEAFLRDAAEKAKDGITSGWMETSGPEAWFESEIMHNNFDRLSGVSSHSRTRDDRILENVFDQLEAKLSICKSIVVFSHKFLAHSAFPKSTKRLKSTQRGLHLRRLLACQRVICQVANFVDGMILWHSSSGLFPQPQHDHLRDFEKRLVAPENKEALCEFWKEHVAEIESWTTAKWTDRFSAES